MKKTYYLTNDHNLNPVTNWSEAYYSQYPNNNAYSLCQFKLCVNRLRQIFPKFSSAETINVTVSTTRQHRAGEFAVRILEHNYIGKIKAKRQIIQLVQSVITILKRDLGDSPVFYVTIK